MRELRIVVTADGAQAKRELGEVEKSTKGVTTATGDLDKQMATTTGTMSSAQLAMLGLGAAFVTQHIIGYAEKILAFADRMQDLSQQTHIGVEALQKFDYVALGAGTTVEVLAEAFAKLTARLAGGDPSAVRGLELLGLTTQRYLALSPEQRIFAVAEAAAKLGDETQRDQALYEMFGRRFTELTPLMTAQLRELTNHAPIIREDELEAIARFHDLIEQGGRKSMVWAANFFDASLASLQFNAQVKEINREVDRASQSIDRFVAEQTALLDIHKRLVPSLKDLTLSGVELKFVEDDLTESVKRSIKAHTDSVKAMDEAGKAAKKAAEEHTNLQRILGLGHMQAAREFVEATTIMRSELLAFNATIDEVTEHFRTTWTQDVTVTVYDSSQLLGETLDSLARQGKLGMEDMTLSISEYFRAMFADIGAGVGELLFLIGDALGPQFNGIMRDFQDAWRHGRSMVQGVLKGLSGDFSGWVQAILGGIGLVRSAWGALSRLFGGGEEGTVVNPARDRFLSQWGDPSNKGVGGAGWNLASILTELGAGEGGGELFSLLQKADTMALFRPAAQAIVELLRSHGRDAEMNFATGGMVPRTGMALVHRDEGVLTPRGVAAVGGPEGVQALNRGLTMTGVEGKLDRLSDVMAMLATTMQQQAEQLPRIVSQEAMLARGRRLAHV